MTLAEDILNAQPLLIRPFIKKPLLVRTPLAIVEQFNPTHIFLQFFDPGDYGDDQDIYCYLRLWPKYEPEDEPQGERGYLTTFSGTANRSATIRKGFRATIAQPQYFIFQIIDRLREICGTSNPHTPIKIIDFCRFESDAIEYTDGKASVRFGRIDIEKPPAAIRGVGIDYASEEWAFKFTELELTD